MLLFQPEMMVLSFFLSESSDEVADHGPADRHPGWFAQLRVPVWVLGARILFRGLDGELTTAARMTPVKYDAGHDARYLRSVELGGAAARVDASKPVLAFMSESQDYYLDHTAQDDGVAEMGVEQSEKFYRSQRVSALTRVNKLIPKMRAGDDKWYGFGRQVCAWYKAVRLTSYHAHVQPALQNLIGSIGVGP